MDIDPAPWSVDDRYEDAARRRRVVPPGSLEAIVAAMGASATRRRPPPGPPLRVIRAGAATPIADPVEVVLEDGTALGRRDALPPDLPCGYHDLVPAGDGEPIRLIVSPGRCRLPPGGRTWGWAIQLYAARSRASWGIGDLADLRRLTRWARGQGAAMVAVNPLHAGGPALPRQRSPYYPSSRRFQEPLYLRVEEVPGAAQLGDDLSRLATAGRALNRERHIDRDRVWRLKAEALEACFARFPTDPAFDAFGAEQGDALRGFATFCAIAEVHGNDWRRWPAPLRRPDGPAVSRLARERAPRVAFHAWLQWLLDVQAGAGTLPVVRDLAVGFDPGGADAWAWQDLLAPGMRAGAPPDPFNTQGQNWGLPPFVPWKLRAARYEPIIQTLRASFRHAGGLRVDHVMGLFRLFWIPEGAGPHAGAYVRYPAAELLDILALESHRSGAFVVGEDLGTVEDAVRAELARRDILSYRVLWFETEPPERYPLNSLAAATTHDLPTVSGIWTGADLSARREIGLPPNPAGAAEMRRRLSERTGLHDGAAVEAVIRAAYRALARAPSRVVVATLDDALGVRERPNMPGTVHAWPNWSLGLPVPLEEVERHPGAIALAGVMAGERPR
ncbi:MAG: 4-alpha-glucanotransferase [Acidimicrobiales bacterium]